MAAPKTPTPAELASLEHAFAADPGSEAWRPLTDAYLAMGRFMEAMVVAKKGVRAHPSDVTARLALARVYAEQGKDRKALEEVQGALAAHMVEHQWATDLLYQGLVTPSEERWQKGLAAMAATPLAEKDLPKDAKLTKEVIALEKKVHELAGRAKAASDLGTKVAFYGEYIGGCAGCHELHGKVWGPGLPKT